MTGGKRILFLATDAFGGYGGVALYSRDVIEAMCLDPEVALVHAIPRVITGPEEDMPTQKLVWDKSGLAGKGAYVRAVLKAVIGGGFDMIYCAHVNLAPIAWLAAKLARIPWALCVYGIDVWPGFTQATPRFARRANLVIALSQVTLDRFLAWSGMSAGRGIVVRNAIHLDRYGEGPKRPDLLAKYGLEGAKVVMTMGRLDPREAYKGFDEVIDVLPDLVPVVPEIKYLIVGKGDDQPRVAELARSKGVADRVIFAGFVPEEDKADVYRLADVYAMPGRGEGFGFVMLEAMACGVPAIGSDIDGTREAVREGLIGQVVHPDDREAIKAAILRALAQKRGIPEGISYFAFPEFAKRVAAAVNRLAAG